MFWMSLCWRGCFPTSRVSPVHHINAPPLHWYEQGEWQIGRTHEKTSPANSCWLVPERVFVVPLLIPAAFFNLRETSRSNKKLDSCSSSYECSCSSRINQPTNAFFHFKYQVLSPIVVAQCFIPFFVKVMSGEIHFVLFSVSSQSNSYQQNETRMSCTSAFSS